MNTNINVFEVFPWNENFETGNLKIDEQHKVLVGLLNKLSCTLVNQTDLELNDALNELANYAKMHFADEQIIWEESFCDDPWLFEHIKAHESFLPAVMKIKEQAADNSLPDIIGKMVHFLVQWLMSHIIHSDKRMVLAISILESSLSIEEAKHLANEKMSGSEKTLIDAILNMYGGMSSRTIALMREVSARKEAERKLSEANKKLEEMSIIDPLTGVFNRRHMNTIFAEKLGKAVRDKTPLNLFLIDIDFFKKINDYYGHLEGDKALKKVSSCLQKHCRRPDDIVFRIGGEEFVILTTNETEKDAYQFAESLRMAVEELQIPNHQSEAGEYMTISIGVNHKIPDTENGQDEFTRIADKRLYQAKKLGRNQVVITD
ncbi:GGDEF domain-containing protein [Candidatus Halobeggiatoa sp. HSG11]|nr:GGDEF domain-containing protein [Candidatus Halobeggiatoa sp. HSG11]